MKKKILTLTVSKEWFDMIAAGEKTEEYREIKGYWVRRIFDISNMNVDADTYAWALQENIIISRESFFEYQSKGFTHVLFINGYRKDSPRIEKEIESISIGKPKKGICPDKWLDTEFFIIKFKQRMTNKDFFNAYRGEPVLYKGNDIGAYVAGYVEEKYIILGFYDDKGCILTFNIDVDVDDVYTSYRFAKLKYLTLIEHQL